MNIINQNSNSFDATYAESASMSKTFVSNVFTWMSLALVVTSLVAYAFGTEHSLKNLLFNESGRTGLFWIAAFAPLGLVLLMGARFQRMSLGAMVGLFGAFSILMGISLGSIFMIYEMDSILATFGITGLTFGAMALLGYTTKTDLTKFGSILIMALIGIIIASVINAWFLQSGPLGYVISILGVLIFTGLTAYDVQKLKRIGAGADMRDASTQKLVIFGALTLYLDFINLFLFLLRFFGSRD
jgi:FtsH-binding integral membrane protein